MALQNILHLLLLEELEEEDLIRLLFEELILEEDGGDNDRRFQLQRVDIDFWRGLDDFTFRKHFRMGRAVFEKLVVAVGRHLQETGRITFLRTPLDVALMMTIWILATPDTFRSTATTFGTSMGVVFFHYIYLIEVLRELCEIYVKWPGPRERDVIKTNFEERYGYLGVVGCIDCCQIPILAPSDQPEHYINRHHQHAVIVQAVCDHNFLYRDVYVGEPGGVGDIRTFRRSPLSTNLFLRGGFLSDGEHLLGDGAYPLSEQILIPYINDGHLTERQRRHNYLLSRSRSMIERSFALLQGKFRRLQHLPTKRIEYTVDHIMASILLHNFIILEGELPGLPFDEVEVYEVPNNDRFIREAIQDARGAGAAKRYLIANMLFGGAA